MTIDAAAAQAAGITLEEQLYTDYFGFHEETKWFFPDGAQYLVIQKMNEGAKSRYQREVRSDITIARATGDAKMQPDPSKERHALIKACVKNWFVITKDQAGNRIEPPFSVSSGKINLESFLASANPKVVEDIEKACRKANPWLLSEMSVEDIDAEIENLKEMREEAAKREAGE